MADAQTNPEPRPQEASVQLQLSVTAAPKAAEGPKGAEAAKAEPRGKAPWLTPVTAPILVALLALIAPVTAAVNAHYQAKLQLELDRQKQADERTRLYLERAISADAGAESRVQVLRFLQLQTTDPMLQQWAVAELAGLSEEVDSLKEKEASLVTEVAQQQQTVVNLVLEQDELSTRIGSVPTSEQPQLRDRIDKVKRSLERERVTQAEKTAKLSQVSSRLRGGPEVRYVEAQVVAPGVVAPMGATMPVLQSAPVRRP